MNVRILPEKALWIRTNVIGSPPGIPDKAYLFRHEQEILISVLQEPLETEGARISVYLSLGLKDAPPSGSIIRINCGMEQLWLTVMEAAEASFGSPPVDGVRVTGEAMWLSEYRPGRIEDSSPIIEKLTFELLVKEGDKPLARLNNLGFACSHPRFWGALPTDEALFKDYLAPKISPHKDLVVDASAPRFPLAAADKVAAFYLPLGTEFLPDHFLNAEKQNGNAMTRDGLSVFSEDLFLDPGLKDIGIEQLITHSDFLRYQTQPGYKLGGIHAALNIEEPTLIAVPDASHRKWKRAVRSDPPKPSKSLLPFRTEWWHHLDCNLREEEIKKRPEVLRAEKPEWENFLKCEIRTISAPQLWALECEETNIFELFWSPIEGAGYILQEAANPDWTDAVDIYTGTENRFVVYGHGDGVYYYRVCAELDNVRSGWSNEESADLSWSREWQLDKSDKSSDTLLSIHRALLRLCAARGDLFAVLALPEHFREEYSVTYVERLQLSSYPGTFKVAGFFAAEAPEFSYGAVYHPWLIVQEEGEAPFRSIPPDGAICGIMAKRALSRGAWVAPANELMTGIVTLTPHIDEAWRLELLQTHINLVRQEPYGFVTLSADTLSDDPDLRPINVRRLLILLRRMALRLGVRYVFEPHDDSFRRMVRGGFEALLDDMFMRGAFAGNTPGTSYQVVTSTSINTQQSMDQGRFIVELKVAPSLPMTFLAIRLLQTGDRLSVSEGK
jgi:hypothetical protein